MQKSSFLFLLLLCGIALLGAWQAVSGAEAQQAIVRFLALSAYFLLCVSLMIGPLSVFSLSFAHLIEPRRAVGLAAFAFAALHILLVAGLYLGWNLGFILSQFSLWIAVPAAAILAAMALTSSDFAVARLGMASWKALQRFVYPAFALITIHFFIIAGQPSFSGFDAAELLLLALGGITVILQVAGFVKKRGRGAQPSAAPA